MLAAALENNDAMMAKRISQHERLWGYMWLQDPVFQSASDAWQAAKAGGRAAI